MRKGFMVAIAFGNLGVYFSFTKRAWHIMLGIFGISLFFYNFGWVTGVLSEWITVQLKNQGVKDVGEWMEQYMNDKKAYEIIIKQKNK